MKSLIQDLDQAYLKKTNTIASQSSYYYSVKVPYQATTTSYQESKRSISISISEMPDSWLYGKGQDGKTAFGMNNIADPMFIYFDSRKIDEVKKKIITKTGYTNIEVPSQEILLFQAGYETGFHGGWASLNEVSNTDSGKRVVVYQVDTNGNYGKAQGCWQSSAENFDNTLRFFYKATTEIKHTNTSYKDESRFDSERYNRDLAKIEQDINSCKTKIKDLIINAQNQLNTQHSTLKLLQTDIAVMQQKILTKNVDFVRELQDNLNNEQLLEQSITKEKQALDGLAGKILSQTNSTKGADFVLEFQDRLNNKQLFEQSIVKEKQTLATLADKILMQEQIESSTPQQRAQLFAESFAIPEKKFVVEIIDKLGLDAKLLGVLAITKNSKALLDKALHYKVNFGSCYYEEKSLLQHLISKGNQDLIDFVLKLDNQDLKSTLFTAVTQNDLLSIKTILSHSPDLIKSLDEHASSLLHVAVNLSKIDIVNTLLNFDSTIVNIKDSNLETPLNVALRVNNPEIKQLLLKHVNLDHEIELINQNHDTELLGKIEALKQINVTTENTEHLLQSQIHSSEDTELIGQFKDYDIV